MEDIVIIFERKINGKIFKFSFGSIIDEPVEAIVNPANENLIHGGGVAGLISRIGGFEIQAESDKKAPIPTGSATYTKAGKLPFKYIIHTVGPIFKGGDSNENKQLSSAIKSALTVADELNLKSISIPTVSTGIFGYPLIPAIEIITETIFDFMKNRSSMEEIRLCEVEKNKADQIKKFLENKEKLETGRG